MKNILYIALIAIIAVGAVYIFKPSSPTPTPQIDTPPVRIGLLIKSTKHQYWKTIAEAAYQAAAKHHVDLIVIGNTTPNDGLEQLERCETLLLKKPDAMIVAAINLTNLQSCLKKASVLGIPVIDIDGNITRESAQEYSLNVAFSVAADNYLLGQKAAEYVADRSGNVLILEGLPGSIPSLERKRGFVENMPDTLNIIASSTTDWDRLKAYDITSDILLKHPEVSVIFAAADIMAMGAYEAAKKAGRADDITIIGIDGNAEAIQAIKQGKLAASVAQLPVLMLEQAIEKTLRFLDGKPYDFEQYLPTVVLTQPLFDENADPLLEYVITD